MKKPAVIHRSAGGYFVTNIFAAPHSEIYAGATIPERPVFDRTITKDELQKQIRAGQPMLVCRRWQNN